MASSRQSKNSPIGLPPTDTLSVDISNWVYNGAIAENSQLKQVVEQQQQELTDKTQAQEQLVKKTRLLEKKLDEEVERARVAKRKLDVAEAKIVEKENTAQTLRKGLEASQAAVVASNEAYEEAMSKTSALRQQLVETKAELSSAQATLDESKTMTQTELDAAKSECEEVRQALETAKAENVAKQSEISKLSELNDRYAARLEVYAQSYARAKDIFDTLGQLHMLSGREAVTGGGAERNVIVAGVSVSPVNMSRIVEPFLTSLMDSRPL
jgi:chromosome segregation ATPase